MINPLFRLFGRDERILVGAETADDAGVFRFGDRALVATADFITPVCDDPRRGSLRIHRVPPRHVRLSAHPFGYYRRGSFRSAGVRRWPWL